MNFVKSPSVFVTIGNSDNFAEDANVFSDSEIFVTEQSLRIVGFGDFLSKQKFALGNSGVGLFGLGDLDAAIF